MTKKEKYSAIEPCQEELQISKVLFYDINSMEGKTDEAANYMRLVLTGGPATIL